VAIIQATDILIYWRRFNSRSILAEVGRCGREDRLAGWLAGPSASDTGGMGTCERRRYPAMRYTILSDAYSTRASEIIHPTLCRRWGKPAVVGDGFRAIPAGATEQFAGMHTVQNALKSTVDVA
jgi:hypothetical protein